jgi:hypothetical protein
MSRRSGSKGANSNSKKHCEPHHALNSSDHVNLLNEFCCIGTYFVIQSIFMKTSHRFLAALELLLVLPAVLFMASLFARSIQPVQYEPAHSAQMIVNWYAARPHMGLWILLGALPIAVFSIGLLTLARQWGHDKELRNAAQSLFALIRSHAATLLIAGATTAAGCILAIVALHIIAG